jgi:membrane associated rhomboid family serine protease
VFYRGQKIQVTAVNLLIGLNVLGFVFSLIFGQWLGDAILGLSSRGMAQGMVWQLITYQFVHGGLMHLIVNMAGLWFTGPVLENIFGPWRFVRLYFAAGVLGGLMQLILSPGPTLVGASGSVCGLVAAYSALFPEMEITALLFFVIPVRMKAKWLGIGVVATSLFFLITGIMGNIGNAAHIGGALVGYAYVRYLKSRFRVVR